MLLLLEKFGAKGRGDKTLRLAVPLVSLLDILSSFSLFPVLSVCLSSAFFSPVFPAFALCLVWSCLAPLLLMVVAAFTFLSFSGP